MVKEIFKWEVVADFRCKTPRYVVYYMGQWDYHLMDWAGCNFRRIKAPNQPKFTKILEAQKWAKENEPEGIEGEGTHVSEYVGEKFQYRILAETYKEWKEKEIMQSEWEERRKTYKIMISDDEE